MKRCCWNHKLLLWISSVRLFFIKISWYCSLSLVLSMLKKLILEKKYRGLRDPVRLCWMLNGGARSKKGKVGKVGKVRKIPLFRFIVRKRGIFPFFVFRKRGNFPFFDLLFEKGENSPFSFFEYNIKEYPNIKHKSKTGKNHHARFFNKKVSYNPSTRLS